MGSPTGMIGQTDSYVEWSSEKRIGLFCSMMMMKAARSIPIFALANEHNPDPEMRPYKDPISIELRETLIVRAAAGATQIYRYFKTQRLLDHDPLCNMPTFRRKTPKIGRNDPCPCGSGKKFKQCCGKITLH